MGSHSSPVQVFIRIRPSNNFAEELIKCYSDQQTLSVRSKRDLRKKDKPAKSRVFTLNGVLKDASQEEVYDQVARPTLWDALQGYNGTIMCFGQTGAGKTYTMTGATQSYSQRGIIPRTLQQVFQEIKNHADRKFSIQLSFLEIYNETMVDLLASLKQTDGSNDGTLSVVENQAGGVSVKGLSLHPVYSEEEALNCLFEGELNRIIGEHSLNKHSSRSHCIFTIHIQSRSHIASDAKYISSKLNLVDLAGSERLSKTKSEGQVQTEAMYINKSLCFLEQTIMALADSKREHVPFRQCKLTYVLKDSIGGNCNTILVANIYGEEEQIDETLSTLRFATRMKCVQTTPLVNEHINPELQVKKLQKEIRFLKEELSWQHSLKNPSGELNKMMSKMQVEEVKHQVQSFLSGKVDEIPVTSLAQIHEMCTQFKHVVQELQNILREQQAAKSPGHEKATNTDGKTPEPAGAVGNVEKSGIDLGLAPSTDKAGAQKAAKGKKQTKKDKQTRKADANPSSVDSSTGQADEHSALTDLEKAELQQKAGGDLQNSGALLPRAQAFEDFKAKQGKEMNDKLKQNKAVLVQNVATIRGLVDIINVTKQNIDSLSSALRQLKEPRQDQEEPAVEDEEKFLKMELEKLGRLYRQTYEVLKKLKTDLVNFQNMVDTNRAQLLKEFECWYKESYPSLEEDLSSLEGGAIRPGHTSEEKDSSPNGSGHSDRLQAQGHSSGAVSYHKVYNMTVQRRRANSQFTLTSQPKPREEKME